MSGLSYANMPQDKMLHPAPIEPRTGVKKRKVAGSEDDDLPLLPEMTSEDFSNFMNNLVGQHEMEQSSDGNAGPAEEDGGRGGNKKGFMRLPEVIGTLAAEGKSLRWDEGNNWYQVLDGPAFEAAFNELRCKRGDQAKPGRPFSRMHTHFLLVRGEKWAGTGSCFTPKIQQNTTNQVKEGSPVSYAGNAENSSAAVSADKISVTLRSNENPGGFQCSLQHFLDITGAGEMYKTARENQLYAYSGPSSSSSSTRGDADDIGEAGVEHKSIYPVVGEDERAPSPLDTSDRLISSQDISVLVGTMWSADARGDQAYFFRRKRGVPSFENGAIVSLINGELCHDDVDEDRGLFMVVSDKNAKWKGEPMPTPEEEKTGHWCAFLGQVPVQVQGKVRCGDYIGPRGDGSGIGVVCTVGQRAVIGIALASKESDEVGIVKTLVFAGLNAMTKRDDDAYKNTFKHALEMQRSIHELRGNLRVVERNMESVQENMGITDHHVSTLEQRVERMEHQISGHEEVRLSVAAHGSGEGLVSGPLPWWRRHKYLVGTVFGVILCLVVIIPTVHRFTRGPGGGPLADCIPRQPGARLPPHCPPPPLPPSIEKAEEEEGDYMPPGLGGPMGPGGKGRRQSMNLMYRGMNRLGGHWEKK